MIKKIIEELKKNFSQVDKVHLVEKQPSRDGYPTDSEASQILIRIECSPFDYKKKNELLDFLHARLEEERINAEIVLLSHNHTQSFHFSLNQPSPTPRQLLEQLAQNSHDKHLAYLQFSQFLEDIEYILERCELELPLSGLHAHLFGRELEFLWQKFLEWTFVLYRREYRATEADEKFFKEELCGKDKLFDESMASFSFRLREFTHRHRELMPLVPNNYDQNDLELELFIDEFKKAIQAARHKAQFVLIPPSVHTRKRLQKSRGLTFAGILLVSLALIIFFIQRPVPIMPLSHFSKAKWTGGISASYYSGHNFNRFLLRKVDRQLNFKWKGRPTKGVPADHFSVRWIGYLHAPESGPYEICLRFDDAARLKLANHVLIDEWHGGPARQRCHKMTLLKGWYPLEIEMFEHSSIAVLSLSWKLPSGQRRSIISSKNLCCTRE